MTKPLFRLSFAALTLLGGLVMVPESAALPAQDGEEQASDSDIRRSTVKIFTTSRNPDLSRPWTRQPPGESTGSGVVIEGNRIITNAHVVSYARRILVQPYQSSDRYEASVIARSEGMDIAVLELEDESFFSDNPAAVFADELPSVGQTVNAYGYPLGGDALSVTEGIISRVEYTDYAADTLGLRIQVDSAINPGNSGGPVAADGAVIGLSFSGLTQADNIGFVIPAEEVKAFLEDVEDDVYDGKPYLPESLQTAENPALRERLGLDKDTTGLIVAETLDDSPLQKWDVITAIGDADIDNDGQIRVDENLRLSFQYQVPKQVTPEETVSLSVFRDGEPMTVEYDVSDTSNQLFEPLRNEYPSYFIYGPMCFMPVYAELAQNLGRGAFVMAARQSPIMTRLTDDAEFQGEQIVVVTGRFFPHRITKGYDLSFFPAIKTVNGTEITSLAHLATTLRDLEDEFVEFVFHDADMENLVFKRSEIEDATEEILEDNGIRRQYSDDIAEALGD